MQAQIENLQHALGELRDEIAAERTPTLSLPPLPGRPHARGIVRTGSGKLGHELMQEIAAGGDQAAAQGLAKP